MSADGRSLALAGAGPTGALLAILLRRRGYEVSVYEAGADPRAGPAASGRSINLALAARGINALKRAGVYEELAHDWVPMHGRLIHGREGGTSMQPYGVHPDEVIHSISRHRLNRTLLDIAVRRYGVDVRFEHRLESADFDAGIASVRDLRADRLVPVRMRPLVASDGAGSCMRRAMHGAHLIEAREEDLAHGYKELSIPAGPGGSYVLEREALHVWPRGGFMLIALPNADGSFTATLFLPKSGPDGFASLTDRGRVERFLRAHFPDVVALMPDRLREFEAHPTGFLGTVRAEPWHVRGTAALIGDSAHAIVPFHGQGMNACFEDCLYFDACVARHPSWEEGFADFFAARKADTDAIGEMALENYREMRERVADPKFQLQSALSRELERRHPQRFISRYSMVMFHEEIPYRVAQARGRIQSRLLGDLTDKVSQLGEIDFDVARREVEARLPPLAQDLSSVMKL